MSATLRISGLSTSRGERTLFEGLDLAVAPGDVVGLVGANGAGKSTLLRILAGLGAPRRHRIDRAQPARRDRRAPAAGARAPPGRDGAGLPRPAHRRDGRPGRDGRGRRGARRGRAPTTPTPRRSSAGSRSAAPTSTSAPTQVASELGLGRRARRADDRRCPAGRRPAPDSPRCCSRATTSSCSTSRPTTSTSTGWSGSSGSSPGCAPALVVVSHDREFLARTVTRVVELDLAQQQVAVYGGGYDGYLDEREVARRHAREEYEEYADTKSPLEDRARMQRNWMEQGVRNARRKSTDNDKIGPQVPRRVHREAGRQGPADRAADRAPRRRRGAAQGVGAADGDRRGAALRRGRRDAATTRSSGAATSRSARSTCRSTGPTGSPSPGPNGVGQVHAARRLLGRMPARRRAAPASGSGVVVGEVDQARGLFLGDRAAGSTRSAGSVPDWPDADVRTLLAKFGLGADHVAPAGRHRSRPASAPAPRWRCCRRAGSTCWCSTSRPTTSTCPAIEQLEQALDTFDGTLLLVTHDRRMLETTRSTRRWRLEEGRLSEELL